MRYARARRDVFLAILGISWFWFVGLVFLTQFPTFAKETLNASEQVANLFLAAFSIGIALGSLLCNRLLKGRISRNTCRRIDRHHRCSASIWCSPAPMPPAMPANWSASPLS